MITATRLCRQHLPRRCFVCRLTNNAGGTDETNETAATIRTASIPRRRVVTEYPALEQDINIAHEKTSYKQAAFYVSNAKGAWVKQESPCPRQQSVDEEMLWSSFSLPDYLFANVISHFLPAQYPHSVQSGYTKFTSFCFAASVAGSAGMVLSTQTLLLAVGVVGSHQVQTAGIMAGAMNWVLKDGVGQLGGVWFASRMGHTKRFDTHPKKWRMTAALALDAAALMEILSPFAASSVVLPVACAANVLKNIGFLTASASRAALHQSIALRNNLADVTVKAGSQSMAAGLLGTAVGLGLSTTVLGNDPMNFMFGFCFLSATHLGCNYMAMQYVALDHLNRPRLDLLLEDYLRTGRVRTPDEIASREQYLPLVKDRDSSEWLSIGSSLQALAPNGPNQLDDLLATCPGTNYIISLHGERIQLTFLERATGDDLVLGVFHAYLLRQKQVRSSSNWMDMIRLTFLEAQTKYDDLKAQLQEKEWRPSLTNIESTGSYRLAIDSA